MVKLTRDDVLKLARLARLELTDEEVGRFQTELAAILNYVEKLQQIDVGDLEPTAQVTGLQNVMRQDEIRDYGPTPAELLKNVPEMSGDLIKVKRMIV